MIDEGKDKQKHRASQPSPTDTTTVIETCPMFDETFINHMANNQSLEKKINDFAKFKHTDPTGRFGSRDIADTGSTFENEVPGIRHAAITGDLRIWYTLSGSAPRRLRLYAVLSHEESGTGQPIKQSIIRGAAKRIGSQIPLFKQAKVL